MKRQLELPLTAADAPSRARKAASAAPPPAAPEPQLPLEPCAAYVEAGRRPGLPEHYLAWYETPSGERIGQITVPAPLAEVLAVEHARATRPLPASVPALPEFPMLGIYIRRELYDRDGGHADPRRRFEMELCAGSPLTDLALGLRCACASCGAPIHPFRRRKQPAATAARRRKPASERLYVAVACPLHVSVGCSRGDAAAEAYVELEEALASRGWL